MHLGHTSLDRTDSSHQQWDSVPVIYSTSRRLVDVENAPVVVYRSSPKQASNRKLPALFENNEFMQTRCNINRDQGQRKSSPTFRKPVCQTNQCESDQGANPANDLESTDHQTQSRNATLLGGSCKDLSDPDFSKQCEESILEVCDKPATGRKTETKLSEGREEEQISDNSKSQSFGNLTRTASSTSALADGKKPERVDLRY